MPSSIPRNVASEPMSSPKAGSRNPYSSAARSVNSATPGHEAQKAPMPPTAEARRSSLNQCLTSSSCVSSVELKSWLGNGMRKTSSAASAALCSSTTGSVLTSPGAGTELANGRLLGRSWDRRRLARPELGPRPDAGQPPDRRHRGRAWLRRRRRADAPAGMAAGTNSVSSPLKAHVSSIWKTLMPLSSLQDRGLCAFA